MAKYIIECEIEDGNHSQVLTKSHIEKCILKGKSIEIKPNTKKLGIVAKKTDSPTFDFLTEMRDLSQSFCIKPLAVRNGESASSDEVADLKRQLKEIQAKYNELISEKLNEDQLTGCYSLRYFQKTIEDFQRETEQLSDVAIIYIDVDGFKFINDNIGHTAGDYTLKMLVNILKNNFNNVYRLTDDDFAVVLSGVTKEDADKKVDDVKMEMRSREKELKAQFTDFVSAKSFLNEKEKREAFRAIDQSVFSASFGIGFPEKGKDNRIEILSERAVVKLRVDKEKFHKRQRTGLVLSCEEWR